jgi:transcriptional regulator with AAA-type ATPase domain
VRWVGLRPRFEHAEQVSAETTAPEVDILAPTGRPGAPAIRWLFPTSDGRITLLRRGATVFGRESDVDVSLSGNSVSRAHAEIRWEGAGVPMLRDLDSRNGVFLNGRRVVQAPLRNHDVLRMGDWVGVLTTVPSGSDDCGDGGDQENWKLEEVATGYWAGPVLLATLAPARLIAQTELSIVIQGETGAGKEGAARAIHAWSNRSGPFLALNCATLPETLAESELFGFRKGAFTGADRPSPGFLRAAHGGTLFLDEIADLSLPVQAKLLRAIQEREVVPLGETKPVAIDVRILAAGHVPMREAVRKNRFRDDLYARLKGFIIEIPPLRERVEEIPLLLSKLLGQRCPSAQIPRFDAGAVETLCTHRWPHNMRDLTSLVTRLLALHPGSDTFDRAKVIDLLDTEAQEAETVRGAKVGRGDAEQTTVSPDVETILAALQRHRGNVRRVAIDLGISRNRLYRLMEKDGSLDLKKIRSDGEKAN